MNEMIEFRINDYLGNAGIVGFIKLLEKIDPNRENYEITDTSLKVKTSFLIDTDLTSLYFKVLIDVYHEDCPYTRILNQIDSFIETPDKQEKDFIKKLKSFKKDLESNRYKTGYETIKDKIDISINLYEELKKVVLLKKDDEITNSLIKIKELLNHVVIKETFFMKDIAYFFINNFWDNKSFLNRNNAKKNMKEVHKKEIEEVFKQYLNSKQKGKNICVECGNEITSLDSISSSFVNDFSEDFERKNSNYWDFIPNCYFCPKCLFLYTLIPLGFTKLGDNFLFINQNDSLRALVSANSPKMELENQGEKPNYYDLYNQILQNLGENYLNKINNIQVITRKTKEKQYHFDIINSQILILLSNCKKELRALAKHGYVKDAVGYRNIYEEVFIHILYNQDLYRLLNELLRFNLASKNNEYVIHSCSLIYQIEERRKNMFRENQKNYYPIAREGNEFRKAMEINGKDDATVGISYRMLNALKVQDCNQFLDIIIRLSNALKRKVPKGLIATMNDIEEFKRVGYAFVIGFRGGYYEKEENNKLFDENAIDEKINDELMEGVEE